MAAADSGDLVVIARGRYRERDIVVKPAVSMRGETGVAADVVIEHRLDAHEAKLDRLAREAAAERKRRQNEREEREKEKLEKLKEMSEDDPL